MKFPQLLLLFSFLSLALVAQDKEDAPAQERRLTVNKKASLVSVDVQATVDPFVGHLRQFETVIGVDPTSGAVRSCRFSFKFLDLLTGKPKRDKMMHLWQNTKEYSSVSFELVALEQVLDDMYRARGVLAFHGVNKSVNFPIRVTREKGNYFFDGEVIVNTEEYGLPVLRYLLVCKVEANVKVAFHLEAR